MKIVYVFYVNFQGCLRYDLIVDTYIIKMLRNIAAVTFGRFSSYYNKIELDCANTFKV